jgi:hypothetical protein
MHDLTYTMENWSGITNWDVSNPKGAYSQRSIQSDEEKTVVLTFTKNGKVVRLEMAQQKSAKDNLRVLYIAVDAMRMNDRRGIGEVVENAYKQLASPTGFIDPYQVFGLQKGLPLAVYEAMYKDLAKKAHPDTGGSAEEFKKLNEAMDLIRKETL